MHQLLQWLALPEYGLATLFLVALVSATLLPMGSEPAVVGLLHLNPGLFWPTIFVATLGNTIGGSISWWMGLGAQRAWARARAARARHGHPPQPRHAQSRSQRVARLWLRRFGAKACVMSWLPIVGDPLCAVAGWLRLPFWPCLLYMGIGKFLRYLVLTAGVLYWWPQN